MLTMESTIFAHTRKLIQHGIFNRLSDVQFSQLYIILLREYSNQSIAELFKLWMKADFSQCHLKYQLMSDTNSILKEYNMPQLEENLHLEEA